MAKKKMAAMTLIMSFPGGSNSEIHHMDMDFKHDMTDWPICPNIIPFRRSDEGHAYIGIFLMMEEQNGCYG